EARDFARRSFRHTPRGIRETRAGASPGGGARTPIRRLPRARRSRGSPSESPESYSGHRHRRDEVAREPKSADAGEMHTVPQALILAVPGPRRCRSGDRAGVRPRVTRMRLNERRRFMPAMKFGVFVPQGWRMDLTAIADPVEQFEAMTDVAREADKGPWDSIWVFDHFHTVPTPTMNTTFESWTITATLARDTTRVNIGQM